ncbi:MAG: UDP-3-O-(3-hydroxymyristoyl)glucosamine N-acyltransferase [Longimicrobiales bacterium]|nr:UDP-3-O-(3-hydroxymyristoyl)glucosamine N-acyltransferase [Longimicrobiales bacterium]
MTRGLRDIFPLTLADLSTRVGGRTDGDGALRVDAVLPLDRAGSSDLAPVSDAKYLPSVPASAAGALLVAERLVDRVAEIDARPRVVVRDPHAALIPLLRHLDPTPRHPPGVHPTAVIEEGVSLGEGVSVGPYAVLEEGCAIGAGSRVGAHCVIGRGARIGEDGYLHPHVVVYAGCEIGARAVIHAGARIGSDGFGFAVGEGRSRKIPQVGRAILGDDVEVGANTTIDRGSLGDTEVGDGVKFDNLVHIAHNVRVGADGFFAALVGIAGSTRIGARVRMGGQSGAVGHLDLPDDLSVGAASKLLGDLDPGDRRVMGYPAGAGDEVARVWAAQRRLPDLLRRVRALERAVGKAWVDDDEPDDEGE